MSDCRISAVIPVYRAAAYLPALLDDLIGQTHPFYEIIPVDDASDDESGDILRRYAENHPFIKPIFLKENVGLSGARNRGFSQVTGDYVLFLDADDRVQPNLNEALCTALAGWSTDVVLFGLREEYYDKSGILRKSVDILPRQAGFFAGRDAIVSQIAVLEEQTLFGYAWNKLYRTALLKENDLSFETVTLIEDVLFNCEVFSRIDTLQVIREGLYRYRRNTESESLTGKFLPDYFSLNRRRVERLHTLLGSDRTVETRERDILGTILSRYLFSALCRNCDKRAGMDHRARKAFLTAFYEDPLYGQLIPFAEGKGKLSRVLCRLLQKKRTGLCLATGRLIYIVKAKLPLLFAGLKQ